nr:nucleotidyltransferase family protein [Bacteroidales bacterium]
MTQLPAEQLPPQAVRMRLLADVDRIERRGRELVAVQSELLGRFSAAGLHPVVQKGSEAGKYYAYPLLRESGDIDLCFPSGEFVEAEKMVTGPEGLGPEAHKAADGSLVYPYQGVTIEHHSRYFDLHRPESRLPEVPSVIAELVMLSAHILKHAIGEGVGCKQLCDLALALDRNEGKYDKAALRESLRRCGLLRWQRVLCSLLVADLGLDPDRCLPDFAPCDPAPLRRIVL